MLDFFLNAQNLPFTIAIGLMIGIGLLEGVTTLLGAGASSFLDSMIPDLDADLDIDLDVDADLDIDADAPGADLHDTGSPFALSKFFLWFHVGRVPVLILFVLFLFSFGFSGLLLQWVAFSLSEKVLAWWMVCIPALFIASGFVKALGGVFARILPQDETEAVSEKTFIGLVAVVITGTARRGMPAQAKLKDSFGQTHFVMVEPEDETGDLPTGSRVKIVERLGSVFRVVPAND